MTPAQILKALRRRLVPLAARGLSAAEMRRELGYTLRRFNLSDKVTSALLERAEGELSYVATRTVGVDSRRAAVELVRPFAGPVSRLNGALLQQFERRVLPLVEKGARVADVEARIRRAVGVTEVSAKTLASTVVAGADRAGSLIAAQEAGVTHYRYAGPPGERHFCSDLTRRSAAGETWTLEQIRAMVNGHGLPVEYYCGGYRCRHRWVAAFDSKGEAAILASYPRVLAEDRRVQTAVHDYVLRGLHRFAPPGLSPRYGAILHCYSRGDSSDINTAINRGLWNYGLWDEPLTEWDLAFESLVNEAIALTPVFKGEVYRLMNLPEPAIAAYRKALEYGETKIEWGFTSTSKVLFDGKGFNVEFVIETESGADIEAIAYHGPNHQEDKNQQEVLLPSRLPVRVIKIETSADGSRTRITLRQVKK